MKKIFKHLLSYLVVFVGYLALLHFLDNESTYDKISTWISFIISFYIIFNPVFRYCGDYFNVDDVTNVTIKITKEKPKSFGEEWDEKHGKWREVDENTFMYNEILELVKNLEPNNTSSSLHIYEEVYIVGDNTYKLLYAMGDDTPMIEVKI